MSRFQQFEVWQVSEGRWEQVATFLNFDPAKAMTKGRTNQVRLLKVTYQDGEAVEQEVLAEVGVIRTEP